MSDQYPESWNSTTLLDVSEKVKAGPFGSAITKSMYVADGFKVYGQEQVISGDMSIGNYFIAEEKFAELSSFSVREGDVLMSCVGTFGKTLLVPKDHIPGIINPRLILVRLKDNCCPLFIQYLLSSVLIQDQLLRSQGGGTMGVINATTLKRLRLGIPPLSEQKKIAEILSGVDADISALVESIGRTRLSREALLRNMVPHPSCDFQNESPAVWTLCRLEDVCSLITYGFTNPMPTTPSGVYMVTAKDVRDGRIDKETARFTSHEAYATLLTDKSRPVANDILVTKDGTLGRTAIVRDEVVCINQSVALLRPQKDELAEYLHLLLSSPQYQQTMLDQAGGSAVKHIYITTLAKMEIAMPSSSDHQQKIVQIFASFDDALNAKQRKLVSLQNLRTGLASDLLSGRKRVSV